MTLSIILIAALLAIAVGIRHRIAWFGRFYIPASVIAGLIGLAGIQSLSRITHSNLVSELTDPWKAWPGMLIAVVFAGMLLQRPSSSAPASLCRASQQGVMVWIIVLGQTLVGLIATWLWIGPVYQSPDAFGMLIETGFAGGHGTAAAMGEVFSSTIPTDDQTGPSGVMLENGLDLGITMATVGLVYGMISGIVWVNLGAACGWIHRVPPPTPQDAPLPRNDATQVSDSSIGSAVLSADIIDPLLLQAVWLSLAFAVGLGLQLTVELFVEQIESFLGIAAAEPTHSSVRVSTMVSRFPLFIYTLFGGWIVRSLLFKLGSGNLIDSSTLIRLTSSAMDILVVAAIASLNPTAVAGNLGGLLVLMVAGALWCAFCLLWLSRRILPKTHWFELGLINYGMSTGTTATGFVLLRLVDPELRSGAAEDYAIAAPMSSPFIGGGMITIGLPVLVLGSIPLAQVIAVLTAILFGLIAIGILLSNRNR